MWHTIHNASRKKRNRTARLSPFYFLAIAVSVSCQDHPLSNKQHGPSASPSPVAIVAGSKIYESDFPAWAQGELEQVSQREYQIKRSAVEFAVDHKLMEIEAKRRGITFAQLIQSQQDQKSLLNRLRVRERVSVLLPVPRVPLTYDPARVRGDPRASVTIIEFADFDCPFCRQMEPTLKELLAKYSGKVKLAYRDFPIREIHAHAELAAEASRCAAEQGKFWEYHDLLFANQTSLNPDTYRELGRSAGLDRERFDACLATGKFRAQIESDLQSGGTRPRGPAPESGCRHS